MRYDMKKSGERIRQLRIKKGFTQGSIAGMLNIDRSFYSRIEAGKNGCAIVLQILIEFCARHLVHILPPFVRGWPPLPYSLILHYFVSFVKIYFTFFREI